MKANLVIAKPNKLCDILPICLGDILLYQVLIVFELKSVLKTNHLFLKLIAINCGLFLFPFSVLLKAKYV